MQDFYVPTETGHWVNEGYERLARVVQDYDPNYELRWIPPENRTTLQEQAKPYVIWDLSLNIPVMYASEFDTPAKILEELFLGDNKHGDVLKRLDAHNAAVKALEMKKQIDIDEERKEYAAWLIATKKNFIKLPSGRKVDDQLRPIL